MIAGEENNDGDDGTVRELDERSCFHIRIPAGKAIRRKAKESNSKEEKSAQAESLDAKADMVPLRSRAIPEGLMGVFTTRRSTNPRLQQHSTTTKETQQSNAVKTHQGSDVVPDDASQYTGQACFQCCRFV